MLKVITLLLFHTLLVAHPIPIFHPPSDWECALPENHSPFVQVGFVGKGSSAFRPSINLAIEDIDISAQQYLKAVKEIHTADPGTTWRDLGKISTSAGEGRLTEITTRSSIGEVKMLQMILVKEKKAYILTGATIKADYLKLQDLLTKTFKSFSLIPSLLSPASTDHAEQIAALFSAVGEDVPDLIEKQKAARWERLQEIVLKESPKLGRYWQFLVLSEGYEKIYHNHKSAHLEQERNP